jgi:DegV family protein with EDD domain
MAIRIVADSAADLPPELAQQWNITVVPCYVIANDVIYRDGVDILPDQFYHQLETNPRLPTTAQPSAADFQSVYQGLLAQGHQIISIHLSSKLSGTLNSAEQARASLGDEAGRSIEIIDSQLASVPLGLVALAAAQKAQNSDSPRQLAEQVRQDLPLATGFFLLETLEYLQRGGRIGKAHAFLGSVLGVKPILTIRDGEAHPMERLRNRDRAVRRLVELAGQLAPLRHLAVIYSTERERAEDLRGRLSSLAPQNEIIVTRFGPTLGTYAGPGALGVGLIRAGGAVGP